MATFIANEALVSQLAEAIAQDITSLQQLIQAMSQNAEILGRAVRDEAYQNIASRVRYMDQQLSSARAQVFQVQTSMISYIGKVKQATIVLD